MSAESITLPSRFDYSYHQEFSAAYQAILGKTGVSTVILDFAAVEYLDSAALGMMLLLQRRFSPLSISVKVRSARGTAGEILTMANMQNIFEFI